MSEHERLELIQLLGWLQGLKIRYPSIEIPRHFLDTLAKLTQFYDSQN